MDPNPISIAAAASTSTDDADDWDTEGFAVPSILSGDSGSHAGANSSVATSAASANPTNPEADKIEEKIHLGPDGLSSSHYTIQQQPLSSTGLDTSAAANASTSRKQKLKHKLREADKKYVAKTNGHENRIENLREIMGGGNQTNSSDAALKGSSRDWLDPHCHESEFDRCCLVEGLIASSLKCTFMFVVAAFLLLSCSDSNPVELRESLSVKLI